MMASLTQILQVKVSPVRVDGAPFAATLFSVESHKALAEDGEDGMLPTLKSSTSICDLWMLFVSLTSRDQPPALLIA